MPHPFALTKLVNNSVEYRSKGSMNSIGIRIKNNENSILKQAEFCEWTCHYTADYSNPRCADDGNSSDGGSDSECGSDSDSDEGEW